MQTARVGKRGYSAQQTVTHEKNKQGFPENVLSEKRVYKKQIHRNAAELERKVPPVITGVSQYKGENQLFPDLAYEHENTACKEEETVLFGNKFYE